MMGREKERNGEGRAKGEEGSRSGMRSRKICEGIGKKRVDAG